MAKVCKCREKMASILRERIAGLEYAVRLADEMGKMADSLEARARRNEAQMILNTVLLEVF